MIKLIEHYAKYKSKIELEFNNFDDLVNYVNEKDKFLKDCKIDRNYLRVVICIGGKENE